MDFVELPPGGKVILNRCVCRLKPNVNGMIIHYKERLVVRESRQGEGADYYKTFSPVARFDTIVSV